MSVLPHLVALLAVTAALVLYIVHSVHSTDRLRGFVVFQMLMIAIFGGQLMNLGGAVSNITSVSYAGVMAALLVIHERAGRQEALNTFKMLQFALLSFFIPAYVLMHFPAMPSNELAGNAIIEVLRTAPQVILISFASFIIAGVCLLEIFERTSVRVGATAATILAFAGAMAADSLAFYAVAFWDRPLGDALHFMLAGFGIKFAVSLLFVPVVLYSRQIFNRRPIDGSVAGLP